MGRGDFDNVKVGDFVASQKFGGDGYDKLPVEKVTATRFTVGGSGYTKRQGKMVRGSIFGRTYVHLWTEYCDIANTEAEQRRQRNDNIRRYKEINPRSLSDEQLAAILAITEQQPGPAP